MPIAQNNLHAPCFRILEQVLVSTSRAAQPFHSPEICKLSRVIGIVSKFRVTEKVLERVIECPEVSSSFRGQLLSPRIAEQLAYFRGITPQNYCPRQLFETSGHSLTRSSSFPELCRWLCDQESCCAEMTCSLFQGPGSGGRGLPLGNRNRSAISAQKFSIEE